MAVLIYNADVKNFLSGTVSRSKIKNICVPGLNCYSCPAAVSSCPLGSLQNFIASGKFPFFITGFLLLIGVLIGRTVCGFLCPFGLIQELFEKIGNLLKKAFKIEKKVFYKDTVLGNISRKSTLTKYFILFIFVIFMPFIIYLRNGIGSPFFCSLICPAGTLEAGIPLLLLNDTLRSAASFLFNWKLFILFIIIVWSLFVYRPFCRYICPLGAIYSFFNKIAIFGVKVDSEKCINCDKCINFCKMDVRAINDRECIRCGDCISVCPVDAISISCLYKSKKVSNKNIRSRYD